MVADKKKIMVVRISFLIIWL